MMVKAQRRVMEMEKCEAEAVTEKKRTLLDRVTLLEKGIKIPNPDQFK
jgi:hypothetical protein